MKIHRLKTGFLSQPSAGKDNQHDIFLYGVVGWDINVNRLWNELQNLPTGVDTINFYMNSPGGLVDEGYALLTNLTRLKTQYHTVGWIDGMAASMMSAIAVNMDELVASPTSKMLIHDPGYGLDIYGRFNRTKLKDLIESLSDLKEGLEGDAEVMAWPYAQKTGMSIEEVQAAWLNDGKDHELTPNQMLEANLIDRIETGEMPKPDNLIEEDEDDWMSSMITGLKAAMKTGETPPLYRGVHEKLFASLAFDKKNDNHIPINSPQTNPDRKMKFALIAKKLNLDPAVDENVIVNHIDSIQKNVETLTSEKEQLDALVEQHKTAKTNLETENKKLKTDLHKSKSASVVNDVIADATKDAKGKKVNMKIKDKLAELAVDYMQAQDAGNEKQAENIKEHMNLLAVNNLIPIGENEDLGDDPAQTRQHQPATKGAVDDSKLEAAAERGKKLAEKSKKSWGNAPSMSTNHRQAV